MLIRDLYSHKIHSSGDDWGEKLIDIATIFSEFDGKPFDRVLIEDRLSAISPRASKVARDPSKFRDEISAYPAYLGLYRVEDIGGEWHIFLSNTAKQFLIGEEPNVSAFMMLQMLLFQYPNGMGVAYRSNSDKLRIQSNARDRTLDFVAKGIHLCPFRLICKGLLGKSIIENISPLDTILTLDEVFILANHPAINTCANPEVAIVVNVLNEYISGNIETIKEYESRFHILKHTDFLVSDRRGIQIRKSFNNIDKAELLKKFNLINSISLQFNRFDFSTDKDELLNEIRAGSWGIYFDGISTIDPEVVKALVNENPTIITEFDQDKIVEYKNVEVYRAAAIYDLKEFRSVDNEESSESKNKKVVYTDPEITRIRRQRANLTHRIVLDKIRSYLENRGVKSFENEHIDLFAELPSSERYVFEIKSINEDNLLSQTRKGVSQLYEYRYRYQSMIGYDVQLCLIFPYEPSSVEWLQEYLCTDRNIGVLWFDEGENLCHSVFCKNIVKPLNEIAVSVA